MRNTLLIAVVLVFVCFSIASCAKKPDVQYYEDYWIVYFKFKRAIRLAGYSHRGLSDDIREEMKAFLEKEKKYSHLHSYYTLNHLAQWSRGNFVLAAVSDVDANHERIFYTATMSNWEDKYAEAEMQEFGIELDLSEIEKQVNSP